MLSVERRNQITEKLQTEQRVLVSELAAQYSVTEETIRRDLEKLEREGVARRSYGGAVLWDSGKMDLPSSVRKRKNVTAKEKIAKTIMQLVQDGDHILLDDSSTAYFVAKALRLKNNLTVITNSIEILSVLSDVQGWSILSTGGTLREGSLSLVGYRAEEMLRSYYVDKAIISCKGLDLERGYTDSTDESAQIKKAMMDSARKTILTVDSSKLNRISLVQIGHLQQLEALVTEKDPGDRWREELEKYQVECLY